jgi:hypothetical protein
LSGGDGCPAIRSRSWRTRQISAPSSSCFAGSVSFIIWSKSCSRCALRSARRSDIEHSQRGTIGTFQSGRLRQNVARFARFIRTVFLRLCIRGLRTEPQPPAQLDRSLATTIGKTRSTPRKRKTIGSLNSRRAVCVLPSSRLRSPVFSFTLTPP